MTLVLHDAAFDELDTTTLYRLLALRVDVFVVEQDCAYPELDGRDLEPDAHHVWYSEGDRPLAYLRVLTDPDGSARIGRVVVHPEARGRNLAGRLIDAVLLGLDGRRCVLSAQAHLTNLYARHGFVVSGPEYIEDRIPHVPMTREPAV